MARLKVPLLAFPAALQFHGLPPQRQVREVLWTADKFLARVDARQRQHSHLCVQPFDFFGALILITKTANPMHLVEEVDCRAVAQVNNSVCAELRPHAPAQVEHPHILTRRQIDPDIGVERGGRDTLQDRAAHADYLKPYFFLAERVYKSCERRKFSCSRHRSSGVAARLRANRCFSSSLRPRTWRNFFSTRASFFSIEGD